MLKQQNIWLFIYLIMIIVPISLSLIGVEKPIAVPWFPIKDFHQFQNIAIVFFTTLVPLIGSLGLLKLILFKKVSKTIKTSLIIILVPLICWFIYGTIAFIWLIIFYANNGPEIG